MLRERQTPGGIYRISLQINAGLYPPLPSTGSVPVYMHYKRFFYLLLNYLPYLCHIHFYMFSKTCEYAIRAVLYIAQMSKNGDKVSIKSISKGIDSPEHFIAKILQELSKKGLVQSLKGPTGGFYLSEQSKKHSLADIVRAIDGEKIFTGCGLGIGQCSEEFPCPLHKDFKMIRKKLFDLLQKTKVNEFNNQLEMQLAFLKKNHN